MEHTSLIHPIYRLSKNETQAAVTLFELVNTVIDEAGEDDAQLVNAIIADLMQSVKIKWAGKCTSNSLCC